MNTAASVVGQAEDASWAMGQAEQAAWMDAMRRHDFEHAWTIADHALERRRAAGQVCYDWPRHFQSVWDGTALANKRVLIRCYHGLGDTIQFIRFAAAVREVAREVIVWVHPALVGLIGSARGVDRVLPLHDGTPEVDYDVDLELMEVLHALRVDARSIPGHVPYLVPPSTTRPAAELADAPHPRVGIAWQAGDWDGRRSIPTPLIAELVAGANVRFFSLQYGPAAAEITSSGVPDLGNEDVSTTAANVCELDLVISVDTMMAHLAGALGVRTWTLLHAHHDWRWTMSGSTSVWYPTMQLFRQPPLGDWNSVLTQVRSALTALMPVASKTPFPQAQRTACN
ncbi:MAG: hypothetical protein ACJ8FM_21550 [Xanthobacteraceae bacterium]